MLLRLSAASETISMDRKKKSRSFQNPDMTYQQILNKIIEAYPSLDSNWIRAEEKIREPILQYEETDCISPGRTAVYLLAGKTWGILSKKAFHRKLAGVSLEGTVKRVEESVTLTPTVREDRTIASWASSNTNVATVDSNGKVTALKAGEATITVTVEGTEEKKEFVSLDQVTE